MRTAIQVEHTGKVARITHIHRIGNGGNGRTGIVLSCLQILIENIILIVGGDKTADGQAHLFAEQACSNVTKVSARHTDDGILCPAGLLQLRIGIKVIECLRQETCHVDRVSRGQQQPFVQFVIHKGCFHQRLAVVKRSVHLQGCNIPPQRSELFFLYLADFSLRIEHIHMNPLYPQKAIGYRTTGISGSGNEHIHLFPPLFPDEVSQQTGHKPSTYIFKSQCRTVEKLQGIDVLLHRHQRDIKIQRIINDLFQRFRRNIFSKESICHPVSNFPERKILYLVIKLLRQGFDGHGHE